MFSLRSLSLNDCHRIPSIAPMIPRCSLGTGNRAMRLPRAQAALVGGTYRHQAYSKHFEAEILCKKRGSIKHIPRDKQTAPSSFPKFRNCLEAEFGVLLPGFVCQVCGRQLTDFSSYCSGTQQKLCGCISPSGNTGSMDEWLDKQNHPTAHTHTDTHTRQNWIFEEIHQELSPVTCNQPRQLDLIDLVVVLRENDEGFPKLLKNRLRKTCRASNDIAIGKTG